MARTLLGQSRDPVCGAWVSEDSHPWTHLHIKYAFCSEHCRERFKRWPHLYVGEATYGLAERQTGKSVKKAHRIRLVDEIGAERLDSLRKSIGLLKGVEAVEIKGNEVIVAYDLVQVSLSEIEQAIIEEIGGLRAQVTDRVRRAIIHYSEECELDNLAHLASHYRR